MVKQWDFAVNLAKNSLSSPQIMKIVNTAFPNNGLSISQIYRIIKRVKDCEDMDNKRNENPKKTRRTDAFVNEIKEIVEANRRISVSQLASVSASTKSMLSCTTIWDHVKTSW